MFLFPPSLLEMMLESALTDIKESTPTMLPSLTQNALKLLRLLQDFLFSEGQSNPALWSEKVGGDLRTSEEPCRIRPGRVHLVQPPVSHRGQPVPLEGQQQGREAEAFP